eukprot:scaffold10050_cov47-Attheya_sp.AAC.1
MIDRDRQVPFMLLVRCCLPRTLYLLTRLPVGGGYIACRLTLESSAFEARSYAIPLERTTL